MITDSVCVRHFYLFAIDYQKLIQYFYNSPYTNHSNNDIPIWILMIFMKSNLLLRIYTRIYTFRAILLKEKNFCFTSPIENIYLFYSYMKPFFNKSNALSEIKNKLIEKYFFKS